MSISPDAIAKADQRAAAASDRLDRLVDAVRAHDCDRLACPSLDVVLDLLGGPALDNAWLLMEALHRLAGRRALDLPGVIAP